LNEFERCHVVILALWHYSYSLFL